MDIPNPGARIPSPASPLKFRENPVGFSTLREWEGGWNGLEGGIGKESRILGEIQGESRRESWECSLGTDLGWNLILVYGGVWICVQIHGIHSLLIPDPQLFFPRKTQLGSIHIHHVRNLLN